MKKTQKALLPLLCGVLCFMLLACASSGGGGGGAAAPADFGPGTLVTGNWFAFDDQGPENGGSSVIEFTEIEVDGIQGFHITGNTTTQYQYGFVGWGVEPVDESLELVKKARAISFMVQGDGKRQTVKYRVGTVNDHAHHEFHFVASEEPTRIEVPIRLFMQPSWGTPARMNQDLFQDISWQTHESWRPSSFELTIWDLRVH